MSCTNQKVFQPENNYFDVADRVILRQVGSQIIYDNTNGKITFNENQMLLTLNGHISEDTTSLVRAFGLVSKINGIWLADGVWTIEVHGIKPNRENHIDVLYFKQGKFIEVKYEIGEELSELYLSKDSGEVVNYSFQDDELYAINHYQLNKLTRTTTVDEVSFQFQREDYPSQTDCGGFYLMDTSSSCVSHYCKNCIMDTAILKRVENNELVLQDLNGDKIDLEKMPNFEKKRLLRLLNSRLNITDTLVYQKLVRCK